MNEWLSIITFFQRSLIVSILIGLSCSLIGVFVVLRGLSFIGVGIANAAFAGVALGVLTGYYPALTGLIVSLIIAWLIGHTSTRGELKLDATIGIFFAFTMAIGLFFMGLLPENQKQDMSNYLFGSLILVSSFDFYLIAGFSLFLIVMIVLFFKEFYFITFDQDLAEASGIPATFFFYFLLCLITVTIVTSLRAVGQILVMAMIIIPAVTACQFTYNIRIALVLSAIFGVISSVGGLFLSYNMKWLTVPTGAIMVIIATIIFFISVSFSPKRINK